MKFVISEEEVGHPGTFPILFTLNSENSIHVLFFTYYIVSR